MTKLLPPDTTSTTFFLALHYTTIGEAFSVSEGFIIFYFLGFYIFYFFWFFIFIGVIYYLQQQLKSYVYSIYSIIGQYSKV